MRLRCLSAEDIVSALPMPEAIAAAKRAYVALSENRAEAPQRQVVPVDSTGAVTLVMAGRVENEGLATKVVSVFPENERLGKPVINGLVLVLDQTTGEPRAVLDGAFLTAWRTGAAGGVATDLLARSDARRAAVLGSGAQAPAQIMALDCVRKFEEIRLFNRTTERAKELAAGLADRLRARLVVAESVAEALGSADVVTCVTSSSEPLFAGSLLEPGAHVNAMGSFTLEMRELDAQAIARSRVFVDRVESALAEAGELVAAVEAGVSRSEEWIEIGRVASGESPGRTSDDDITLFKSVGQAVQDVVASAAVVRAAEAAGGGVLVDL